MYKFEEPYFGVIFHGDYRLRTGKPVSERKRRESAATSPTAVFGI
jgi:hypothetical protein